MTALVHTSAPVGVDLLTVTTRVEINCTTFEPGLTSSEATTIDTTGKTDIFIKFRSERPEY